MEGCGKVLTKNQILGIAAALILLVGCTMAGEWKRSSAPGLSDAGRSLSQEEEESQVIPITEEEAEILEKLKSAMEQGDLEQAGRMLNQIEEIMVTLYYEKTEGRPCRYDDGILTFELEGSGMVLKGSGTCFYGTFSAAGPEGFCRAVKGTILEQPRCDFSEGEWKEGKMEGTGKTGYCYYEGTQGEEVADVFRQGGFVQDLLDGPFTYHSTNGEGETSVWTMEADHGTLILDDRWEYLEDKMEYRLPSDNDETHVYVVLESSNSEPVWGNAHRWE